MTKDYLTENEVQRRTSGALTTVKYLLAMAFVAFVLLAIVFSSDPRRLSQETAAPPASTDPKH
jgi:hypothetical protein